MALSTVKVPESGGADEDADLAPIRGRLAPSAGAMQFQMARSGPLTFWSCEASIPGVLYATLRGLSMTSGLSSLVFAAAATGAGLLSLAAADAQVVRPVPIRPPAGGGFNPGFPQRSTNDFNTTPPRSAPLGQGLSTPTGTPTASSAGEFGGSGEAAAEQPVDETAAEAVIDDYLARHDLVGALPAVAKARAIRHGGG
jgi:hypothetical protein